MLGPERTATASRKASGFEAWLLRALRVWQSLAGEGGSASENHRDFSSAQALPHLSSGTGGGARIHVRSWAMGKLG